MSDRAELRNPLYRNWVRAAIGLKYLQQGLAGFVSNLSAKRHQTHIYSYRKVTGSPAHSCTECTADNLLPEHPRKTCIQKYRSKCFCNSPAGRRNCPNNFCSRFYDLIVLDHEERNPVWINTDPSSWYGQHWSFARCFLATAGYSDKHSAGDTDAAGLLSILINNVDFRASLDNISNFEEMKNTRNDIVHSATFELEERKLMKCLDECIGVLKDKKLLIHDADAQQAVTKLERLKTDEIHISSVEADELHKKALEAIAEKKDEVLAEIDQRTSESIERIRETEKKKTSKIISNAMTQTVTDSNSSTQTEVINTVSDLKKQELQHYLVDLYRKGYLKTDLSPLVPEVEVDVEKVYVPLKMFKRIGSKTGAAPVHTLSEIFFCGNKDAKCIYISGDAGIGKTTLCRKIISEWCNTHSILSSHIPIKEDMDNDPKEINTQSDSVNEIQNSNNDDVLLFSDDVPKRRQSDNDDENYFLLESDDNLSDAEYSSDGSECNNSTVSTCNKGAMSQVKCEEDNHKELEQYNYLFFISLRDAYKERSIEEMVYSQLLRKQNLQDNFRFVLDEDPDRCLFILDGLDEWVPPFRLPTHPTVTRGLPISCGEGDFTKLFTSRPWKIELLRPNLGDNDLDISIQGIEESSVERLVRNSFDELASDKDEVELNTVIFLQKLKEMNIECLGSVPLLLKLLVCLFERDGELADTQFGIYSLVISKLCFLAVGRNENNGTFESLMSQVERQRYELPPCLNEYPVCYRFSSLLHSLGRLSFETIFHDNRETALVFTDKDLTHYGISQAENELSLLIGLLSKKKVIGSSKMNPVRCVSFIHKTFQEYFAALYIAMTYEQDMAVLERVRERFTTTEGILNISKVLYFIKDINPLILSRVTEEVEVNDKHDNKFRLAVKKNELILKKQKMKSNTIMFAELLMSGQISSILVQSSEFGNLAFRFPVTLENVDSIEFDSVGMTRSAFQDIIESMPDTPGGVSLKLRDVAWKSKDEFQGSIKCKHIRSMEISNTNVCDLGLTFSESLRTLECVKFYMVTMNAKELVELLNSIHGTHHDVIIIFADGLFTNTASEDSKILTQTLTKCSNFKTFLCKTKHVRSITFRYSGNTLNCQYLKLDEVSGNELICLKFLESKIERHDSATVIHVVSTEHKKKTDMYYLGPRCATICLGCSKETIHSLHLTNIAVTDKDLCEILSNSKLNELVSFQMVDSDVKETSSENKYLLLKCHKLVMKRVNMRDIQVSLSRSASSLALEDVTFSEEGFLRLLNSIKDIKNKVTLELENISLTKRLDILSDADRPVQCGNINNFTKLLTADWESLKGRVYSMDNLYALKTCIKHREIDKLELKKYINADLDKQSEINIWPLEYLAIVYTYKQMVFPDRYVCLEIVCLEDISITENILCVLLEVHGCLRSMMLNKVTITNASLSERLVECGCVASLTIKQTHLDNILMSFPDAPYKLCLENTKMTENAFCAFLGSSTERRNIHIYSIELDNITLTNISASYRHINFESVYYLTVKRLILSNIVITFHHLEECFHFLLEDITMPEASLTEMLNSLSSDVFDETLYMTDVYTVSGEKMGYKNIKRMVPTKAKKHHVDSNTVYFNH